MIDEMINTVRAAFAPGADAATKQHAAALLRSLAAVLETGGAVPHTDSPPHPVAPGEPPKPPDLLGLILEQLRPHLPTATEVTPRLNIPLLRIG